MHDKQLPPQSRRSFFKNAAVAGAGVAALTTMGTVPGAGKGWRASAAPPGKTVAIFGAGPAGMTAAHELAERGFAVTLYEARNVLGGKTRSIYAPNSGSTPLPGEHGFRSFFGFYHNLPDTMRRIPFAGNKNGVWDNLVRLEAAMIAGVNRHNLTIPLPFPIPLPQLPMTLKAFIDSVSSVLETVWRLPAQEALFAAERLGVYVTSCDERKFGQWENITWTDFAKLNNSSKEYNRFLGDGFIKELVATKSANCSANAIGLVGESYVWSLLGINNDGGAAGEGNDRVLNGPTSEQFVNPWGDYLRSIGVKIQLEQQLSSFKTNGKHIASATVSGSGGTNAVEADYYISAIPHERFSTVLDDAMVAADPALAGARKLQNAWMVGLQYFLKSRHDLANGHVGYNDASWGLTSISEAQFWKKPLTSYGDGTVKDVLSAIISDWDTPGMFNKKTAKQCTPEEIVKETWEQIKAHVNGDGVTQLTDDMVHSTLIDTGLTGAGTPQIAYDDSIFIQNAGSWTQRPEAATGIDNLMLAGDWIKTDMNVSCMEGANEGGRRAANAVLHASGSSQGAVELHKQFKQLLWEPFKAVDAGLYRANLPNEFDIVDGGRKPH
ncbi:FAD-dependent oxidoreductase [Nocardia sp. NPDC056000]|uniref:hydroxysqualene dehydroxylase n=1 Tax=Nocardia sp. NPDC056000 TaxID=3345674 RepID=UPI0035E09080